MIVQEKTSKIIKKRPEDARCLLQSKSNVAKKDKWQLVFSYNLQRTQLIPYLNTNRDYYSRQLSLFNSGIYRLNDNQAFMCIWHENESKRRSLELASRIYEFLKLYPMNEIRKIHSFSDCCGGQNRNKNIIVFMMWCCNEFKIDEWQHTHMENGHSFLPNDQNFGKIEQMKKRRNAIYSMDEWKRSSQHHRSKSHVKL